MSNIETLKLIEEKRELLEELNELFYEGADATLEYIRNRYVNPDEAFVIGYMTGVNAMELIQKDNK